MEMHPLFIKSDESFATFEEQADKIADILVDDEKKKLPFREFDVTSYLFYGA